MRILCLPLPRLSSRFSVFRALNLRIHHRYHGEQAAVRRLSRSSQYPPYPLHDLSEHAALTTPIFPAAAASIVAIFAVRMTDGTGRPAEARSRTATSPGQPRFSALVIIRTQARPCTS